MKKYLSFVLMLCMLLSVAAPTLVFAETPNLALGKEVANAKINGSNPNYCADLTDGVIADAISTEYGVWFAYYYNADLDADRLAQMANTNSEGVAIPTIDLGGEYDLESVRMHIVDKADWGICAPTSAIAQVSNDGETFVDVAIVTEFAPGVSWVEFDLSGQTAQYVRIAIDLGSVWFFLDEIEVYGVGASGGDIEEPSEEPSEPSDEPSAPEEPDTPEEPEEPIENVEELLGEPSANPSFDLTMDLAVDTNGNLVLTVSTENVADGVELNGLFADLYFNEKALSLVTPVDDNNALQCISKTPAGAYENICCYRPKEHHIVIGLGNVEEPFAPITAEDPVELIFTFALNEGYDFADFCIPHATVSGHDMDFVDYDGNGGYIALGEDTPVVPEEPEVPGVESLIPGEGTEWVKTDVGGASVEVAYDNGTVFFFGSMPETWPSVYAGYQKPITADVDNDLLSIDFTVENGATNINFFFDDGNGGSYTYSISNTALMAACPEANVDCVGDLHDGVYSCTISVADLVSSFATYMGTAFPADAVVDGKINFVGINVYSVNGAVIKVKDLSIVHNEAEEPVIPEPPVEPEDPEEPEDVVNLVAGLEYVISEQFHMGGEDVGWGWDENAPASYPDDGFELTDGTWPLAGEGYSAAGWMAFNQNTPAQRDRGYAYVRFDLGEVVDLSLAKVVTLKDIPTGIQPAYMIEVWISADGEIYELAGEYRPESDAHSALADKTVHELEIALKGNAQYVEFRFVSYGWAFLGEIEIYGAAVNEEQKTYENTMVEGEDGNFSCEVPYGFTWVIDDLNGSIGGEDNTICTTQDAYNVCNPNWAITIYAEKQADGTYVALKDAIVCPGSAAGAGITIGENQIAIVIHSAYSNPNGTNWESKVVAMAVKAGDVLVVDMDAMTVYAPIPGESEEPEPSFKYGDVNGDGVTNSADVARLMRYLADYDYAAGTSSVEIFAGADCNGDGIVDGRDSVKLLQYLADREPPVAG